MRRTLTVVLGTLFALSATSVVAAGSKAAIGVNVLLNADITDAHLAELGRYGKIGEVLHELDALTLKTREDRLGEIRSLPYVAAVNPDAERLGAPIDTVTVDGFEGGVNTWNLDAVNVTNFNPDAFDDESGDFLTGERTVSQDGSGVYVAVLDTGLLDSWRQYFPEERIAEEYAIAFGGGGGERGNVSNQPNKWEHDTHGHGTHVTSTIIGYSLDGIPINGVAPNATIIPVKVLNQNGSGWSSVVARGISYIAELKEGPLSEDPVVINMSLGGPELDAVEKAAIDRAIEAGVIVVASAGNSGEEGMGFPGAYPPVISAAASGWTGEWATDDVFDPTWWWMKDVADPTDPDDFYIAEFSSRALLDQDLDVAAPGSWVVGPFQLQQGKTDYFFLGGTSMAAPHVAGIAALMMQKNGSLAADDVEGILEGSAIPFDFGGDPELCRTVFDVITFTEAEFCFGQDATGAGLTTADAALEATPAAP